MRISINKSIIHGVVTAPSSKSYTIRGLMCAALAKGVSEIVYPLSSDDTRAALSVLEKIGVGVSSLNGSIRVKGGSFHAPDRDLFCGESAATLRFMTAICSVVPGSITLTAGPSLSKRPVKPLVMALQQLGVDVSCENEFAPVKIAGGRLKGGTTELPGNISSQYVSALLIAAPLAEEKVTIKLTTPAESKPYIAMTLECLSRFGVEVDSTLELREFQVQPQRYNQARYTVEGDWSSASYLLALGAAAGVAEVKNLNTESFQGDKVILGYLKEMGASVDEKDNTVVVKKQGLKAIKADLTDCIDLLPTVAVLAALSEGTSELSGIKRARLKESDRVSALKEGLEKAGVSVKEEENRLIITGGEMRNCVIDSKNDHRIAMAFSIAGASRGGVVIDGAECVSKTYPDYWRVLESLGGKLDYEQ